MIEQTLKQIPFKMAAKQAHQRFTLTIVFHPDLQRIGQQYQTQAASIHISRLSPLFGRGLNDPCPEPLADNFLSRTPISINKNGNDWHLSNEDSPIHLSTVNEANLRHMTLTTAMLEKGVPIILAGRIVLLCHLRQPIEDAMADDMGLVGVSHNLCQVRSLISKVAQLKTPVLIRGESGTGKELVAQAIHKYSERSVKPLVCVNMAAISKELVNAELFGSVKGAFTGAISRDGYFKEAHGSCLFLDEIGEASQEVQIALLRALETGVIQAVGSDKTTNIDTRFIAATDADLEALIGKESFRMPLLQRLSGLVIELAPVNKRREDIGSILLALLVNALKETQQLDKLYSAEQNNCAYWAWLFAQCCELNWPGNVRQLKNMVTQLSIALLGNKDVDTFAWHDFILSIQKQHLLSENNTKNERGTNTTDSTSEKRKPRDIKDKEILIALEKHQWQIKLAADELCISRAALYQKIDASPLIRRASHIPFSELKTSFKDCNGDLDKMVTKLQVSRQALKRRLHEIGLHD